MKRDAAIAEFINSMNLDRVEPRARELSWIVLILEHIYEVDLTASDWAIMRIEEIADLLITFRLFGKAAQ